MAKLLPVTGLVAAVLTPVMAVTTAAGPVMAILPLLAVLAGVFAILERGRSNIVLGVILIVAGAVLAFLAIPQGVSVGGTGQASQAAGPGEWSQWLAVLGGTLAILAVVATRWGRLEPMWAPVAAIVLAVVALALLAWKYDSLGQPTIDAAVLYPAAILLLAAGYPNLVALRAPVAHVAAHPGEPHAEPAEHAKPARARKTAAKR
ncbi:MAG: hypothetical protein ABR562_06050 [Thermoplasmatota archaeon]